MAILAASGSSSASTPQGAALPFTEYVAATDGSTDGAVLPVDYQFGSLQAEATGRQAVELTGEGQYVSFTLTSAANAVDIHYAVPDAPGGGGLTAPLSLYVNGAKATSLSLTSKYNWLYGEYPYSKTPSVGEPGGYNGSQVPHDFYNDVRYLFSSSLAVGTVVKLQVDSGDDAPWYAINTADFETVAAPLTRPAGDIDATAAPYNADPTGANDSTTALQNAINAASSAGEGLYLPQGTYKVSAPLTVNDVTIVGAGEWYTTLTGSNVEFAGKQSPASSNVNISDLAIFGQVSTRDNSSSANTGFNGGFSDSTFKNVWIQNEKSGIYDIGPANGLTVDNLRIQDLTADGINLYAAQGGVTGSTVENTFVRNSGDDGIALWSAAGADTGDTITNDTVDSPNLANNIGVYGGGDGVKVTDNLLQDSVEFGGGIEIAQNYGAVAFSGTLTISGNELLRTGQFDPGWDYGTGAIWIYPAQSSMSSTIDITGNSILDSPYEAFMFQNSNHYSGSATATPPNTGNSVTGVSITDDTVTNVGTFVFQDQAPGSATVSGTTATGVSGAGIFSCGSGFTLNQTGGDSGFSTSTCSMPSSTPLWVYPGVTTFQGAQVGQATATQQVGIMNTASSATPVTSVETSSGFTATPDPSHPCTGSRDAAAVTDSQSWCMVDVSFKPGSAGTATGTLTVVGSTGVKTTVQLIGTTNGTAAAGGSSPSPSPSPSPSGSGSGSSGSGSGSGSGTAGSGSGSGSTSSGSGGSGTAGTDLALDQRVSASSSTPGYAAANAVDGNQASYWESSDGTWPATLSVDLGAVDPVTSMDITVPQSWPTRTQTLSVLGSSDGSSWATLVGSATYTWDPAAGDSVTIKLPSGASARYLQLAFTANDVQNGAQVAEWDVYGVPKANLAQGKPATASSTETWFSASNAVAGNPSSDWSFWEGADGSWPATLTVDLGSAQSISEVVIDVPWTWPTRTQTLSVLGSSDGSSWATLVGSATYTWDPAAGNSVTIKLPSGASARYLQLAFTANDVQNGAQVAVLRVFG